MARKAYSSRTVAAKILALSSAEDSAALKEEIYLCFIWGLKLPAEVLPVLRPLLSRDDAEFVRWTINVIGRIGKRASGCLEDLFRVAEIEDRTWQAARFAAVNAIWLVSGDAKLVAPFLLSYIETYPEEACDLIAKTKTAPKEVVSALTKLLEKDDWDELWAAVDALGALGKRASAAKPALLRLTRHKSGAISQRAIEAVMRVGGK